MYARLAHVERCIHMQTARTSRPAAQSAADQRDQHAAGRLSPYRGRDTAQCKCLPTYDRYATTSQYGIRKELWRFSWYLKHGGS